MFYYVGFRLDVHFFSWYGDLRDRHVLTHPFPTRRSSDLVGNVILDVEEVDEVPFVVFCPFPRAHRMVGNSLADKVMDIQRVRSVLLRQALDGTYLTNAPRMFVADEGTPENTNDDLLQVRWEQRRVGKGGVMTGGFRWSRYN